ncbi:MAG: archaeal heat shock protein Hsp20 [Sulfolobales archaeon]
MRRRKSIFDIFDELIREIDREIYEEFMDLQRRFMSEMRELSEEVERQGSPKRFVYGFRITIGPDGIPRVERFGNVRRQPVREGAQIREIGYSEEVEPLVDIYEDADMVTVVAEMPGVEKDKIKVRAVDRKLIIEAKNGKKYYKEVELPTEVDMDSAKASYKNGVLEVKLKKLKKEEKGKEIHIE